MSRKMIKNSFGKSPKDLARLIGVSRQAIHDMYHRGTLAEAIRRTGRPEHRCKYRREFGMTQAQIAKLTGLPLAKVRFIAEKEPQLLQHFIEISEQKRWEKDGTITTRYLEHTLGDITKSVSASAK